MNSIEIRTVTNNRELKQFIRFYYDLYRGSKYAVPFLFFDEWNTLSRDKNPSFECCDTEYFMAFREGKMVGRVAAIINKRANERWNRREVRFGWFDFVDDIEVSRALLQAVEDWGRSQGMNEIAGPLGFTDMDREGMLVEGFEELATVYINYNHPYYPKHMEQLGGWKKDNDYMEYKVKVPEVVPDKFAKLSEMIEKRYNLHPRKFTSHELVEEGMGRYIFHLINDTYKDLYGYSELSEHQIDQLVDAYIKKADLNLVTGVVDGNADNKLIGFGITFPSFARAMQKSHNGSLWPITLWRVLRALKWHKTDTVDLLLIGVLPEYRAKGANALIFNDLIQQFQRYGFKWAEAMQQMETNTGVQSHWQYLESRQHRRHRCYCKTLTIKD
ncbi:MAG: N-acetyltransferase [Prevotella sp.]|nr:N-acetyltransferase [Prevotella sp.]